ncbi:hypothetical protein BY996DRAFT_4590349 [Phakopsora pachyrhizi]|nr:hypothetical protein BY996DRAFT_4590349 [Phakopsora pachyrhizi]
MNEVAQHQCQPQPGFKFRGDTVEDLQLPPALSITSSTTMAKALEVSSMREFDFLPVIDEETRRPVGYLDTRKFNLSTDLQAPAKDLMTKFKRNKTYQIITPGTPLEELSIFFKDQPFAIVTDHERRFVLGIVVRDDLEK